MADSDGNEQSVPTPMSHKPSLLDWLESILPFQLPRLSLPQAAKNLDKAAARLIDASASNAFTRIDASTQKKAALSRGVVTYIERGINQLDRQENGHEDALALSYLLREAGLQQGNREKILEYASNELHADPPLNDSDQIINDDWLNTFARIASEKSDHDIQTLWGRILAGEIRTPGSVKLRNLSALATFDRDDALFAHNFDSTLTTRNGFTTVISI